MALRVGYIREQFASPLLQFAEEDRGRTFTLVECPSGTGQVISRLTNNEVDVAIALTDPLLAGIAKGSAAYKLVGSYVTTPLNWAVITSSKSKHKKIEDLRGTTLGISRIGSGSHVMAYVMAQQQGWLDTKTNQVEEMAFQVNNNIEGLVRSVNDGSTSAFMWEWFTTKPWADRGDVRFIDSVPTPWPSWMIAAQTKDPSESEPFDFLVSNWLESLTVYINRFTTADTAIQVKYIKDTFGYKEEDIRSWLITVAWTLKAKDIRESVLTHTLDVLHSANVIPASYTASYSHYINTTVANIILTANELANASKYAMMSMLE
ncbi:periplasmic binding protein-like II [Cantharellus anzutake]|uniref:periplasmic binding protein-like II n=1 Tax=Cantharellus anzutake TaxID=1750568 RepID=UPI001907CE6A|nr:periplasmic binding protein-like II [Cantharellus anzutake]KAF8340517.1 periplasmic binding protein-like II [Cantharellus anzutake]